MDLTRLTRDADDLIRKVVSRYNQLYVPAGTISQLELDLMLDDLRKLYDTFKNIGQINLSLRNTLNKPEVKVNIAIPAEQKHSVTSAPLDNEKLSQAAFPEPADTKTEPQTEASMEVFAATNQEAKPENGIEDEKNAEFFTEQEEYAIEHLNENPMQATSEITDIEKPIQDKAETIISDSTEPPSMLADKFNMGSKSLSETMASSKVQGGIGSRLLFQPIADLNTGIGLNDKFSFISELFGNSSVQYDEAIMRINKAVNLDEANWILQKYHSADWEHKHESLARLKDFVKRRFI